LIATALRRLLIESVLHPLTDTLINLFGTQLTQFCRLLGLLVLYRGDLLRPDDVRIEIDHRFLDLVRELDLLNVGVYGTAAIVHGLMLGLIW
jgi:hypothetical protein